MSGISGGTGGGVGGTAVDPASPAAGQIAASEIVDATVTPAAGKIPIADGGGTLDAWVTGTDENNLFRTNDMPFFDGIILETIDPTITSDGATVTLALQKSGGGDLTIQLLSANLIYTAGNIALTPGTDTVPQLNFVYIHDVASTATLAVSTTAFPATEHAPVAVVLVQSAASVVTDGVYKMHAWTDHVKDVGDGHGHLSHVNLRFRKQNADWESGVNPTLTIVGASSPDDVFFSSLIGSVLQLHDHVFPAMDMDPGGAGDPIFVVNDSGTPFNRVTNLNALLSDSTGASMSGKYFSLVIWGAVAEKTGDSQIFVNLPSGTYNGSSGLQQDADKFADFSIPADFKGVGFLIAELKLRHQSAGGGSWTEIDTVDLRGLFPSITAGGQTAQSSVFNDSAFRVQDNTDPTKQIALEASGIATGTVRTITMPDANVDLGNVKVFGNNYTSGVSEAESTTTTAFPAVDDKLTVALPAITGTMLVTARAEISTVVKDKAVYCRLYNSTDAVVLGEAVHTISGAGTDPDYVTVSFMIEVVLAGVAKNMVIQYADDSGSTAHIRRARIVAWRVA